jgi:hypothetical protein
MVVKNPDWRLGMGSSIRRSFFNIRYFVSVQQLLVIDFADRVSGI